MHILGNMYSKFLLACVFFHEKLVPLNTKTLNAGLYPQFSNLINTNIFEKIDTNLLLYDGQIVALLFPALVLWDQYTHSMSRKKKNNSYTAATDNV